MKKTLSRGYLLAVLFSTCTVISANSYAQNYAIPGNVTAADIPDDIHSNSWARLPQVNREDLDDAGKAVFDTIVSPNTGYDTGLRGPVGMWMYSPEMAKGAFALRQRVRYGTAMDQRLTELTIISTAREISNQYEYSAHEPAARRAGLEEGIMDFVKYRKPMNQAAGIAGMGDLEKIIIQFTREVISEPIVSKETFASAITLLGEEGVMDLTGLIGYYNFVALTLKAFNIQRAPGSELLMPVLVED